MSSSTSRDGLLDIDGRADRLGVGERFVRRLVEERRIPYLKIGRASRRRSSPPASSMTT